MDNYKFQFGGAKKKAKADKPNNNTTKQPINTAASANSQSNSTAPIHSNDPSGDINILSWDINRFVELSNKYTDNCKNETCNNNIIDILNQTINKVHIIGLQNSFNLFKDKLVSMPDKFKNINFIHSSHPSNFEMYTYYDTRKFKLSGYDVIHSNNTYSHVLYLVESQKKQNIICINVGKIVDEINNNVTFNVNTLYSPIDRGSVRSNNTGNSYKYYDVKKIPAHTNNDIKIISPDNPMSFKFTEKCNIIIFGNINKLKSITVKYNSESMQLDEKFTLNTATPNNILTNHKLININETLQFEIYDQHLKKINKTSMPKNAPIYAALNYNIEEPTASNHTSPPPGQGTSSLKIDTSSTSAFSATAVSDESTDTTHTQTLSASAVSAETTASSKSTSPIGSPNETSASSKSTSPIGSPNRTTASSNPSSQKKSQIQPLQPTNNIGNVDTSTFTDYNKLINAKCYKYVFTINQQTLLNKFKQKLNNKLTDIDTFTNFRPVTITDQLKLEQKSANELLQLYNITISDDSRTNTNGRIKINIKKNMLNYWTNDPNLTIHGLDSAHDQIDILWYNTESKSYNLIYIELLFFLLNIQNDNVINKIKSHINDLMHSK